jgi:hypothetical protein
MATASLPDMRTTDIAEIPAGVAGATMVSCKFNMSYGTKVQ